MSRIVNESILLLRGSVGPEVGNLQRLLAEMDHRDPVGVPIVADESFGPKTEHALRDLQKTIALPVTGALDPATRKALGPLGFVPFVQSKNCRVFWPKTRALRMIVVHTMECQESNLTAAEDVALWFAGKSPYPAPKASAHYCIDQDSTVQCVRDTDEAWHASQGNTGGIGLEHAGFARQTGDDWADQASSAILWRSAKLAAKICRRYDIFPKRLSLTEIVAGGNGFCGHVDVNAAYGNHGGHTDPGKDFPWASYLALVEESL